jgi:hypothetical protein
MVHYPLPSRPLIFLLLVLGFPLDHGYLLGAREFLEGSIGSPLRVRQLITLIEDSGYRRGMDPRLL